MLYLSQTADPNLVPMIILTPLFQNPYPKTIILDVYYIMDRPPQAT